MAFIDIKNVFDCVRKTTPTQQAVLVALAFHHNKDNGKCCPSYKTLADETRVNERTVSRILKKLQQLGYVDWVSGGRTAGGKSVPNHYTLKLPSHPEGEAAAEAPPSPFQPAEQTDTACTSRRTMSAKQTDTECTSSRAQCPTNHNRTTKKTPTQPKGVEVDEFVKMFEEFWTKYPPDQRYDEEVCRNLYCGLLAASTDPQQFHRKVLASLDAWLKCGRWNKAGGQYIPYLKNWLGKGMWKERPAPTKEWAAQMARENKGYNWDLCEERCQNGTKTGCMAGVKIPPDAQGHDPAVYCRHYIEKLRDIEAEKAEAIAGLRGETTAQCPPQGA